MRLMFGIIFRRQLLINKCMINQTNDLLPRKTFIVHYYDHYVVTIYGKKTT